MAKFKMKFCLDSKSFEIRDNGDNSLTFGFILDEVREGQKLPTRFMVSQKVIGDYRKDEVSKLTKFLDTTFQLEGTNPFAVCYTYDSAYTDLIGSGTLQGWQEYTRPEQDGLYHFLMLTVNIDD